MGVVKKEFTNADLNADYVFEYIWTLNPMFSGIPTTEVSLKWYDKDGYDRSMPDLLQVVDENTVRVFCGKEIEGTNVLYIFFEQTAMIEGRKLFELSENRTPTTDYRVAIGKKDTKSENIQLADLISFFDNTSGSLLISNNLSELSPSGLQVRANIGAASISDFALLSVNKMDKSEYAELQTPQLMNVDFSDQHPNTFSEAHLSGRVHRVGQICILTISFFSNKWIRSNVYPSGVKIGDLPANAKPVHNFYASAGSKHVSVYEPCHLSAKTNGELWVFVGKDKVLYDVQLVYICEP